MRTLLVLAVVAIAGLAFYAGSSSGSQEFLHGDVDCDGDRDAVDALRILQDLAAVEPLPSGCSAEPTPVPGLGLSRDNPVPAGQPYLIPEGWRVTIVDFTPDATQEVLDENQFNDPPAPGKRFSIVRVKVENVSAGNPGDPDVGFAFRMVGSENVGYSTFEASCGVIPDDIDFKPNDVFEGGSLEGNICYETAIGETDFTIFTDYSLSDEEDIRWFAVE